MLKLAGIGGWCNGSTSRSERDNLGSNPSPPAQTNWPLAKFALCSVGSQESDLLDSFKYRSGMKIFGAGIAERTP